MTSLELWLNNSLEERLSHANKILSKYPDRIPVIIDSYDENLYLDKKKYLVPPDLTVGQFLLVLRKRLKIKEDKSIFMFVLDDKIPHPYLNRGFKNRFRIIPSCSELISNYVGKDKHVYGLAGFESVFGHVVYHGLSLCNYTDKISDTHL